MNSIVISFIIVLFSVLVLIEFSFISLVSSLLLVFSLNLFIVLKITSNCKQNDENVDNFETKANNYYYFFVIYYKRKVLFHLKRVCFGFIYDKLSKHLTEIEKTLTEKPFCDNCLEIKNELNVISHLITDNYVEFWYQSIGTDNKDFENDCQQILQKMFLNLFERCEQRINKQMFCQKLIILLENHLNDTKNVQKLSEINENKRIDSIIARVIRLTATEDITRVISNRNSGQKHRDLSLVLMIKEMLSHSVFLPIIDIITDQKFIYENLFYLITNSELKLNHKNKIEYQLQNAINELNHEFKDQIQTIDSIDNSRRKMSEESNGKQLMKQISNDSEEDNFRSFDLNEFSDYESNDDLIAEALEAEEEEENKEKLISNLVITKTEEINYNSYFIMYFIEYDGIFQQIINCEKSGTSFNQKIGLIRKPVLVKRRFSEFIALQKVLERNKTFKRLMRGIKKPTSIQITAQNLLSFAGSANTRLDSSTVEFRRIYLQNFLKQLSNLKAISESPQFKQFLAYGTDASIAFVNSNSDNLSLNIDKVLFRGFKGVISVMKSALPIEAQIGKIDPKFGERTIPETEKLTIKSIATNVESNNSMQLEKKLNIWSQTDLDDSFGLKEDISCDNESRDHCLGTRTLGDGCEDPIAYELNPICNKRETYHWNSSPTSHTISCFLLFITNNIKLIEKIIYRKVIIFIFGTIIERFIEELVSKLITSEMSVRHIHSLHSALWPTNQSEVQNESKVQNDNCLDQTVSALYLHMKSTLDSINPYIRYVSNHLNLRLFLTNFLIKFNDSNKNKLFLYKFCELILDDIE